MDILKWIVIGLAILNFGFMAFDGARGILGLERNANYEHRITLVSYSWNSV